MLIRSGSRRRYRGDTPRPPGTRRSRRQRFVSVLTAVFLLAGLAGARAEGPEPAQEPGGLGLSLDGLLGKALDATDLLAPSGLGRLRVPGEVRVLLVSSGADKATFGDGYAKQLTRSGDVDEVGLGTYAASVLFQVAPKAHVTAVDVYRKGRVHRPAVVDALHWAREHAKEFDAVVLAFPPAALLDPMAHGLADAPGRAEHVAAGLADGWAKLREDAAELAKVGIAVVAPAGDLGPGPQSILGVAGLPEVITVGAADRDGVAAASAGGPSVFGRVKPDLVAPAGIAGLVPDESALAGLLALGGSGGPA
ncbi:MAG TPA: S8 family serine peptidase, partial [Acidimicrobiia bacterium]|nr:S8 family serine peptidase [Acidimicrobiia bacterium]